jgi:L-asparaginase II
MALARSRGELVGAVGDVHAPVFPRSAVKPLQAIAFIERGAADRFGCGTREIALPELGLGFAVKIDDGAKRAAEAAVLRVIARFYPEARDDSANSLVNWQGLEVGAIRTTSAFEGLG